MLSNLRRFSPQIFIFLVVLSFLIRLYFPPSIFYTPDIGQSDVMHINLPMRFEISQSLKNFTLPLWENSINTGFPLLSGSLNFFYLPNILNYFLLPFKYAVPTMYLINFTLAAFGMFYLLKSYKVGSLPAVFGSISFTFSAAMILRVQHFTLQESVSLLPWAILSIKYLSENVSIKKIIITSLVFSQFIFLGFLQLFVYLIMITFIFFTTYLWLENRKRLKIFITAFIATILLGSLISAAQLFPTYELLKQSQRASGLDASVILNDYPLLPKNLFTLINPFNQGNVSDGTYKYFSRSSGIFWENTSYIGKIPLLCALFSLLSLFFIKKNKKLLIAFFSITTLTILLALGKSSPLHIIFSIPPLNFFRVPARFLLFTQLFLVVLASFGIKQIASFIPNKIQNYFYSFIILITILDLFYYWWNYNPIGKTNQWLKAPEIVSYLDKNTTNYRIETLEPYSNWNKVFIKSGWKDKEEYFLFFMNSLAPNYNSFFNIEHFSAYTTLSTRRSILLKSIISPDIKISPEDIKIGEIADKIYNVYGVKYVISTKKVINNNYKEVTKIQKDNYIFYLYENLDVHQKASLFYDYQKIDTIGDYHKAFETKNLDNTVFLEKDPKKTFTPSENSITLNKYSDLSKEYLVKTKNEGILVLSQSFYPEWQAKIDKQETEIIPANINSQAVIVPAGEHIVRFEYRPKSIIIGGLISAISLITATILLVIKKT